MDNQQLWQRYCQFYRFYPEVGIGIDISRMRFPDNFMSSMSDKIQTAFKSMDALEKGEIVNPDEKRMVGHYWLRNASLSPNAEIKNEIEATVRKIKDFAAKVHQGKIKPQSRDRFTNVLLIGIGGSALGPQLVSDALWNQKDPIKINFFDNTDPDGMARTLTQLGDELAETLCIVISKSGGTVETRNGSLEAQAAFTAKGLSYPKHVVAVTCPGSKLEGQAKEEGWLDIFHMWDWVGGRTSIFSAVGLLPAALQGIDVDRFLAGARNMDELTRVKDAANNPAALLSLMWYAAGDGKGKKDMVVLPYKDRICLFSKYLQQLVMESLGKEKDLDGKVVNQGIAVYGNKGSTDQHAYVQQLRDGLNNFFVTFVEVLTDYTAGSDNVSFLEVEPGITSGDYLNGFFQGTRRALFEGGRDSTTITMQELTTESLGALIALYDRTVGFYASLVNINAYHQPGVEAGKKAAAAVIDVQKKLLSHLSQHRGHAQGFTAEELSAAIGAPQEAECAFKVLQHFSANPKRGIELLGDPNPKTARFRAV